MKPQSPLSEEPLPDEPLSEGPLSEGPLSEDRLRGAVQSCREPELPPLAAETLVDALLDVAVGARAESQTVSANRGTVSADLGASSGAGIFGVGSQQVTKSTGHIWTIVACVCLVVISLNSIPVSRLPPTSRKDETRKLTQVELASELAQLRRDIETTDRQVDLASHIFTPNVMATDDARDLTVENERLDNLRWRVRAAESLAVLADTDDETARSRRHSTLLTAYADTPAGQRLRTRIFPKPEKDK